MKKAILVGVVLGLTISAWAGSPDPTQAELQKNPGTVAVITARTMEYNRAVDEPKVSTLPGQSRTELTVDARLYVRTVAQADSGSVAIRQTNVPTVMTRLRECNNNVYALAINTDGVKRANTAYVQNGRVYLRATPSQFSTPVHVAAADGK